MKISIPCGTLLDAVNFISSAVESRNTLPILNNLLFVVKNDRVSIIGTDLEMELEYRIRTDIPGLSFDGEGKFTLPARKLKQLLGVAPDKTAIATLKEETADGNKYSLTFVGTRSRYTLQSLPAEDFPNLESLDKDASKFSLPKKAFVDAISSVEECVPPSDVRYYLNGVQMQAKNNTLLLNATDGHRLAQNSVNYTNIKNAETFNCIVPRKAIKSIPSLLKNSDGELACARTDNHIYIKVELGDHIEGILKSKLIDGRFPDVERVIPKHSTQTVEVNRLALLQACSRASILANDKFRGVRLGFKGDTLTIDSSNPEQESATEELDVICQDMIEIGLNVDYLISPLKKYTTETVLIGLNTMNDAILLTAEGDEHYLNVLMPMRI
jgi:DNA polymerase-3 subunit beta